MSIVKKILEKRKAFISPLAGYTDAVYRDILQNEGAAMTYTEMVSAKGLYYGSENTKHLLKTCNSLPYAVQIFGNDPFIMGEIVKQFNDNDQIILIDINMGCPAHKIIKNGEGSALMKNEKLAFEVTKSVVKNSNKDVSVKFRSGFKNDNITAPSFAKVIEEAGASSITIHGRTTEQMYSGKADLDIIAKVKESVSIPVLGNGDVKSVEDFNSMIEKTKCDGVMIGRGIIGNPFLIRQINEFSDKVEFKSIEDYQKIEMAIMHYKKAVEFYGDKKANREMRKHLAAYLKGIPNSIKVKDFINVEQNPKEVIRLLETLFKENYDI